MFRNLWKVALISLVMIGAISGLLLGTLLGSLIR